MEPRRHSQIITREKVGQLPESIDVRAQFAEIALTFKHSIVGIQ